MPDNKGIVAYNGLKCMLIDNESSTNIIFGATYDQMLVYYKLTPMSSSLYGLTGFSITIREKITLAIEMEKKSPMARHYMEFPVFGV